MPQPGEFFYIRNRAGEYWSGDGWSRNRAGTLYQLTNDNYDALAVIARRIGGELVPMNEQRCRARWWEKWAGWLKALSPGF